MSEVIVTTKEELRQIISDCLSCQNQGNTPIITQEQPKHLHSIRELAEFLNCSIVTAQKLKNSGKIRYKQYGRKVMFNSAEVLEDLGRSGRRVK